MKSNELLPFSRNRYYTGKMLTSSDFEAEQVYGNHKRRFVNQMVTGSGIICGLGVISLDDQSLMIESGVALDDGGREIVLSGSLVKKLSTIQGFDALTGNLASLCIRYKEKESQPVYAVNRQDSGKEYEYNRIEEGYELFLQDAARSDKGFEIETEFFAGGVLYESENYVVRLRFPANLCTGHYAKISVEVEKLSDADVNLTYKGVLQTPVMKDLAGSRELTISLENIMLKTKGTMTKDYWMLVQDEPANDSGVMLKSGSAKAAEGGTAQPAVGNLNCMVNVIDDTPEHVALREAGKMSLELRNMAQAVGAVELARLTLVRTESAYLIERVEENAVKTYIPTMRDKRQRDIFESYYGMKLPYQEGVHIEAQQAPAHAKGHTALRGDFRIETGVVEVPLGDRAKRGDICYSGEIMHGLGKGNVYVQVGLERLEPDAALGDMSKTTVYGNAELFDREVPVVAAETAVKVFDDKGSFMVAVRLLQDVEYLLLTYRWVAIRMNGENTENPIEPVESDKSISAVTPTVVLGTKETYFFQVKYNNMKPCSISYEMTEPASGEIRSDGIYTAPSREGVYEIRIFCTDQPTICTYAYAIVKKKTSSEIAAEQNAADSDK